MNFKKVNFTHDLKITEIPTKITSSYGSTVDGTFYGYLSYKVSDEVANKLLSYIPSQYRQYFYPALLLVNVTLLPHTDSNVITGINFYVDTADGKTNIYKMKPGVEVQESKLETQTDGRIYNREDLIVHESFVANVGDIYVLDLKKIHDVEIQTGTRRMYTLHTDKFSVHDAVQLLEYKDFYENLPK